MPAARAASWRAKCGAVNVDVEVEGIGSGSSAVGDEGPGSSAVGGAGTAEDEDASGCRGLDHVVSCVSVLKK